MPFLKDIPMRRKNVSRSFKYNGSYLWVSEFVAGHSELEKRTIFKIGRTEINVNGIANALCENRGRACLHFARLVEVAGSVPIFTEHQLH